MARQRHYFGQGKEGTTGSTLLSWADTKLRRGDVAGAEAVTREAIAELRAWASPDDPTLVQGQVSLAALLQRQNRFAEAELLFCESYEARIGCDLRLDVGPAAIAKQLALFYDAWNAAEPDPARASEAEKWKKVAAPARPPR